MSKKQKINVRLSSKEKQYDELQEDSEFIGAFITDILRIVREAVGNKKLSFHTRPSYEIMMMISANVTINLFKEITGETDKERRYEALKQFLHEMEDNILCAWAQLDSYKSKDYH